MKFSLVLGFVLAFSLSAFAAREEVIFDQNGNKLPDSQVNSPQVNWRLLSLENGKRYGGIGLVDIMGGSGCTGTFLDTGGGPAAPAYVLSNGHCAGSELMGSRDVLVDRPAGPSMNFRLNYFVDAGPAQRRVAIRRISYATMHLTDVTVFELDATFGELVGAGFVPYAIESRDVSAGERVEMVGVPQSGVARAKRFLRRSTCELGAQVNLREGGYEFGGAYRHQCSSVGGSSGTAMISLSSGRIVAINNTGVSDRAVSSPECEIDRPCEVSGDGSVRTDFNVNYAQRVSDIASCFDRSGVFNLGMSGCRLERP